MHVFEELKTFPQEERYSLTRQIRRSSRSVPANIAEGFRKRQYPSMFVSKLADSDAEATETQVRLDFARDCGYLSIEDYKDLVARYEEVGRMLHAMIDHPERFGPFFKRHPEIRFLHIACCFLPSANCFLPTAFCNDRRPMIEQSFHTIYGAAPEVVVVPRAA